MTTDIMTPNQFEYIMDQLVGSSAYKDKWIDLGLYVQYFAMSGDSAVYPDGRHQQFYYDSEGGMLFLRTVQSKAVSYTDQPVDRRNVVLDRLGEKYFFKLASGGVDSGNESIGIFHDVIPVSSISLIKAAR